MKKIHIITLVIISMFRINAINAQIVPCAAINVEAFPKNPQAGSYNYFGVRVTLAQTYDQDITVNGYIYDEGDPNNDHPYSLTVTAGNLSAETDDNFYQTSPANNAALDISSITPITVINNGTYYNTQCSFPGSNGYYVSEFLNSPYMDTLLVAATQYSLNIKGLLLQTGGTNLSQEYFQFVQTNSEGSPKVRPLQFRVNNRFY